MTSIASTASRLPARLIRFLPKELVEHFEKASYTMHFLAFVGAASAFVSDFINPLIPNCSLWLCIITFVLGLSAYFAPRFQPNWAAKAPGYVVVCAVAFVFTLLMTVFQAVANHPKQGVFADLIPAIGNLQNATLALKSSVDENTRAVQENTAAQKKAAELFSTFNDQEKARVKRADIKTDISFPILVMIQARMADSPLGGDAQLSNAVFLQKLDEYSSLKQGIAQLRAGDPQAQPLLNEAQDALTRADFDEASLKIRQVAEIERASSIMLTNLAREHALDAAHALERSAEIARIALQYRAAAEDLESAARLATPFDPHYAWQLTSARADALFQQGVQLGDESSLGESVDIYRVALSLVAQDTDSADWTKSRDDLGQAVSRLSQNASLAERHRDAVSAYRDALKGGSALRQPADRAAAIAPARDRADELMREQNPSVGTGRRHRIPSGTIAHGEAPVAAPIPAQEQSDSLFGRLKNWATGSPASASAAQPQNSTSPAATPLSALTQHAGRHTRVLNTLQSSSTGTATPKLKRLKSK